MSKPEHNDGRGLENLAPRALPSVPPDTRGAFFSGGSVREIKFRAWDGKEMSNPFNPFVDLLVMFNSTFKTYPVGEGQNHTTPTDKRLKWIQYTGLKDKNGKEIYEGYILKLGDYVVSVHFKSGAFRISQCIGAYGDSLYGWNFTYEIIGNIYENPDLLED